MAKEKNTAAVLAGILAGAAAGLVLGVLFAPEEGKETRKKLKSKANDLKDQAIDEYEKVQLAKARRALYLPESGY
jgi:gas vesicle protein